jgi:hypothetical protein
MARLLLCLLLVLATISLLGCTKATAPQSAAPQQAAPVAAPAQAAPAAAAPATTGPPQYVYVGSDVPTVYHYRSDCTAMRGTPLDITYEQAQQNHLYPCPTCVPGAR